MTFSLISHYPSCMFYIEKERRGNFRSLIAWYSSCFAPIVYSLRRSSILLHTIVLKYLINGMVSCSFAPRTFIRLFEYIVLVIIPWGLQNFRLIHTVRFFQIATANLLIITNGLYRTQSECSHYATAAASPTPV